MQVRALSEQRAQRRPPTKYDSLLDLVGNTPILKLRRVTSELQPQVEVWAKLEFMNPGGSVKDRPARQILLDALDRGDLGDGTSLLDASNGNTAVAYAMLGAALGIPVTVVMPENASPSRRRTVETYGGEVISSSADQGIDGAIQTARRLAEESDTGKYWYADQYANPSNPRAHELTTAPEIWAQTEGRVTHFVTSLATSGTIIGTGRGLRSHNPDIGIVGCQPSDSSHGLAGLKHLESSIQPDIYEADEIDETLFCATEEGYTMADRLAREEGLAVGDSAGASIWAAIEFAKTLDEGVLVTVIADHADRALGE